MGEARVKEAKAAIAGWMGLAMFGCHCGMTLQNHPYRYESEFLFTHLRGAHPELELEHYFRTKKHKLIIRE